MVGAGGATGGLPSTDVVARLNGRWAGQGLVTMARGSPESFKCVVTYRPDGGAAQVQQNLRCSNENYKVDAATHLQFEGTRVSGHWEDKVNNLDGQVSGTLTATGFNILLGGRFFTATMDVTGNDCEQAVKVSPQRGGEHIKEISAALRKC